MALLMTQSETLSAVAVVVVLRRSENNLTKTETLIPPEMFQGHEMC